MTCPICNRLYCDHSPSERGQTQEEMFADMNSPHIIVGGETRKVSIEEYEAHTGEKWRGATNEDNTPKRKDNPELVEARKRYEEVEKGFKEIRTRCDKSLLGKLGIIRKRDNKKLIDYIGVLLPLSIQDSVTQAGENTRFIRLSFEIMNYQANFTNSGVSRIGKYRGGLR